MRDLRCIRCNQEQTASGGDIHCTGDCDSFEHDAEGGCHSFEPAQDVTVTEPAVLSAEEIDRLIHIRTCGCDGSCAMLRNCPSPVLDGIGCDWIANHLDQIIATIAAMQAEIATLRLPLNLTDRIREALARQQAHDNGRDYRYDTDYFSAADLRRMRSGVLQSISNSINLLATAVHQMQAMDAEMERPE